MTLFGQRGSIIELWLTRYDFSGIKVCLPMSWRVEIDPMHTNFAFFY